VVLLVEFRDDSYQGRCSTGEGLTNKFGHLLSGSNLHISRKPCCRLCERETGVASSSRRIIASEQEISASRLEPADSRRRRVCEGSLRNRDRWRIESRQTQIRQKCVFRMPESNCLLFEAPQPAGPFSRNQAQANRNYDSEKTVPTVNEPEQFRVLRSAALVCGPHQCRPLNTGFDFQNSTLSVKLLYSVCFLISISNASVADC
jgi:hypothetical protein